VLAAAGVVKTVAIKRRAEGFQHPHQSALADSVLDRIFRDVSQTQASLSSIQALGQVIQG